MFLQKKNLAAVWLVAGCGGVVSERRSRERACEKSPCHPTNLDALTPYGYNVGPSGRKKVLVPSYFREVQLLLTI